MTCKTCGGRRVVTYIADTCNPQRQGDCPSCVGIRIAGGDAAAAEERDALLSALGWKTGPFGDDLSRKVILDDSAALRPEMVKARRAAQEAQGRAEDYRYMLGEYVHGSRSGVLGRLWEEVKRLRAASPKPPAGGDAGAVERQAVEAMRRSRQAWSNVLEFSLIAESHRDATEALIDQLDEAIAALALPAALSEGRSHG